MYTSFKKIADVALANYQQKRSTKNLVWVIEKKNSLWL
jgi:hypothetical protein